LKKETSKDLSRFKSRRMYKQSPNKLPSLFMKARNRTTLHIQTKQSSSQRSQIPRLFLKLRRNRLSRFALSSSSNSSRRAFIATRLRSFSSSLTRQRNM
jgi:hypothetical protein